MAGVIKPCPWCKNTLMSWSIPAQSRVVTPYCDDCEAAGPSGIVKDRNDLAACLETAIEAWNGAR